MHIATSAGVKIVNTQHLVAAVEETFAKMRADKSGSTCYQNSAICQHEKLSVYGALLHVASVGEEAFAHALTNFVL